MLPPTGSIAATLLSLLCVAAHAQDRLPTKPITLPDGSRLASSIVRIPMEHHSGHIALEVMMNGKGPFRFQLDTGAGIDLCVDLSLMTKLGLEKTGTTLNSATDPSKAVRRDLVRVDEISFGGATFKNRTALAADYAWVNRKRGERVLGLLGFPLFRELLLSIDYPNSRVILTRGRLAARAKHVLSYRGGTKTPHVPITIGKTRVWALLDTGHTGTIMLPRRKLEGIRVNGPLVRAGTGRTVNSSFPTYRASLGETLRFAGHAVDGVHASVYDRARYPILGSRLLKRCVLTFDQKHSLLRVVKPIRPQPPRSDPRHR